MRKKAKLIAVLFVASNGCSLSKSSPYDTPKQQVIKVSQQASIEQVEAFRGIVSGSATTANGTSFSFHTYKSSDGVPISTRFERHISSTSAKKEFLRNISTALEVLGRGNKMDEDGRETGERAVITSKPQGSTNLQIIVLWTAGSQLYYIESPSLQHALEFEKWYLNKS